MSTAPIQTPTIGERAGIMAAHLLFWSTVGFGVCLASGHA